MLTKRLLTALASAAALAGCALEPIEKPATDDTKRAEGGPSTGVSIWGFTLSAPASDSGRGP